jgi:hypothetical protein
MGLRNSVSGVKPSQVTDVYWLTADRRKGKYPEATARNGKWLIFVGNDEVDELWAIVSEAVEEGKLGNQAKVSTAKPNPLSQDPARRVICIYTYDYADKKDVMRVRRELRRLGVTEKIPYKADEDTLAGKYQKLGHRKISKYFE